MQPTSGEGPNDFFHASNFTHRSSSATPPFSFLYSHLSIPPFLSFFHCIPVMTNVKHSQLGVCVCLCVFFFSFSLFGKQDVAKSNVRWDKTAAEASHWSISIRYFCESNRNVWRCCHKLTGSCCLCAPEGNGTFSALLSPPSPLLFFKTYFSVWLLSLFTMVKNLSMAVSCWFWQWGSVLQSELKLEELFLWATWRHVIFWKRRGVCQSQPWCVLIISVPLGGALTVRVRVPSPGQYQCARISYALMSDTATG